MITQAEIKKILVGLLPDGSEQLYALGNSDAIGGTLWALSGALKEGVTDRVGALQLGVTPQTIVESLPEWEAACGLTHTPIAKHGTIAQRRDAVLAVLRLSGSFSRDDLRAVVQPYFLYADPSLIVINEPNRAVLEIAHTYINAVPAAFAPSVTISIAVPDDARTSPAGARLKINITTPDITKISCRLRAPDGFEEVKSIGLLGTVPAAAIAANYHVYFPSMANHIINGNWFFSIESVLGGTLHSTEIFVEGIGNIWDAAFPPNKIGEGLGSLMFSYSVYANPLLLGVGYDLVGAQRALTRFQPAHTTGTII